MYSGASTSWRSDCTARIDYETLESSLHAIGRAYREAEHANRPQAAPLFRLWTDYLSQKWDMDFDRRAAA